MGGSVDHGVEKRYKRDVRGMTRMWVRETDRDGGLIHDHWSGPQLIELYR